MRHVIAHIGPRTGSSTVRRVGRRGRGHQHRKRFVFTILLTIAVGVQLVAVGRYTVYSTYTLSNSSAAICSHFTALPCTENRTYYIQTTVWPSTLSSNWTSKDYGGMSLLFVLPAYDASAAGDALRMVENRTCFVEGLDERNAGTRVTAGGCPCKADWFGPACSVPGFINRSSTPWSKHLFRIRSQPRRIVYAFPFNIEFDMIELLFAELAEVVDVFLILESNYTAYGIPKPLHLLDRLRNGKYSNVAAKLVHVFLDYFPAKAYRDGWVADALHRNYLGTHGLRRLGGLQSDDLLVLTDADELPRRQLLSFLKWHDGYSEPVTISYRWSVFGFFWGVPGVNGTVKTQHTTAKNTAYYSRSNGGHGCLRVPLSDLQYSVGVSLHNTTWIRRSGSSSSGGGVVVVAAVIVVVKERKGSLFI